MFKIAICDDENHFTEELKELLASYMINKGLVFKIDTYNSGETLIELGIEVVKYTVVFLDINMDNVNGIKAAEKIRELIYLYIPVAHGYKNGMETRNSLTKAFQQMGFAKADSIEYNQQRKSNRQDVDRKNKQWQQEIWTDAENDYGADGGAGGRDGTVKSAGSDVMGKAHE